MHAYKNDTQVYYYGFRVWDSPWLKLAVLVAILVFDWYFSDGKLLEENCDLGAGES